MASFAVTTMRGNISLTGSTPRGTVGVCVATDMLDIDDVDNTETDVMAVGATIWGELQLKLEPPILLARGCYNRDKALLHTFY